MDTIYAKSDKSCSSDYPIALFQGTQPANYCNRVSDSLSIAGSCIWTKGSGWGHYGYIVESYPNSDCDDGNGKVTVLSSRPYGCSKMDAIARSPLSKYNGHPAFTECIVVPGSLYPTKQCKNGHVDLDGCPEAQRTLSADQRLRA